MSVPVNEISCIELFPSASYTTSQKPRGGPGTCSQRCAAGAAAQVPLGLSTGCTTAFFPRALEHPGSADAPGFRLHPLKGDRAGQWSVRVSSNWRVVFGFEDGEAVDLIDYQ